MLISEIDFSRVPHQTIQKFIRSVNLRELGDLQTLCYFPAKEPYSRHSIESFVDANIKDVWTTYIKLHPSLCWDSKMICFGMMFSRPEDQVVYHDGDFNELAPGQIYFINLNLIGPLFQIPVMHEIDEVDHKNKVIKTCYLKHGKSEGSQWIRLFEDGENRTRVLHETIYKGESKFREKYLYPYFHSRAIRQFHANVKKHVGTITQDFQFYPPAPNTNPPQTA